MIVATVTTSHVQQGGKIKLLSTTNAIEHKRFDEKLDALNMAVGNVNIMHYLADDKPIVKRKKAYAGVGGVIDYMEEN